MFGYKIGFCLIESCIQLSANLWGRGQRLMPGMCIAIEPMICQYKCAVKTLKDGWTVKTCDGGLAAHFEHTLAITSNGPEVLTHGWEEPGWTL